MIFEFLNQTIEITALKLLRLLVDFGLLVLIWLVQVIIYPSFRYTAQQEFRGWHELYTGLITFFVLPLMFSQVAIIAFQLFTESIWLNYVSAILVVVVWVATFTLSVPAHNRLQKFGNETKVVMRLVNTNWIRTAAWSGVFALAAFGLFQSINL